MAKLVPSDAKKVGVKSIIGGITKLHVILILSLIVNVMTASLLVLMAKTPLFDYVFFEKALPTVCVLTSTYKDPVNSRFYEQNFKSVCEYSAESSQQTIMSSATNIAKEKCAKSRTFLSEAWWQYKLFPEQMDVFCSNK